MPLSLPVFTTAAPSAGLSARLDPIRRQLLAMDEMQSTRFFHLSQFNRIFKTTISLCPECLLHVPAIVYSHEGRVLMSKLCPDHGGSQALIESDEYFYHLSNKDCWGRRFAEDKVMAFPRFEGGCCAGGDCSAPDPSSPVVGDFTDQTSNKTCTLLVEVTNACNLACPVCYSDARGDRKMPLETFKRYMLRLIEQKGGLDSVQLTGGEAVLHPQFWEMVAFLHAQAGVKRIYLPTNGILFARREIAEKLVPFKDKLMLLLQFDGRTVEANDAMRSAHTLRIRQQVIELLQELGVFMQLTMTITAGVNDAEVGWVVDTAMRHPVVKVVALQPVTYSGRYEMNQDPMRRATLSDIVKAVASQARKKTRPDEFVPIPCSHPNCGWITLYVQRFGLTKNIVHHINLARAMDQVAYKTVLSTPEIRGMVGDRPSLLGRASAALGRKLIRAKDVLAIAVKPFMDRFNYDQDRVSNCCHHLMDTRGQAVSFCEYNARLRPADSWEEFPKLSE